MTRCAEFLLLPDLDVGFCERISGHVGRHCVETNGLLFRWWFDSVEVWEAGADVHVYDMSVDGVPETCDG